MNRDSRIGMGCLVLFLLPFCGVGVVTAVLAGRAALAADWSQAGFLSLFAIVFGGVGFGMMAVTIRGRHRVSEIDRLKAASPDEPWLWRPEWGAGRIEGSSRRTMYQAWVFAALWNLISLPGGILGVREGLTTDNKLALLALLFPLIGVGLLVWAFRATARYRKFGVSVFEMDQVPGVIGHGLSGIIRASGTLRHAEFRVKLVCVNRITTGSGKNRSTREKLLWEEQRAIRDAEREDGGAAIRVAFRIPSDVRQSDDSNPSNTIVWRVVADAEVPGVDYHAQFEVPVFRTAASAVEPTQEEEEALERTASAEPYRQSPDSRIRVTSNRRGTEIYFPPARNLGAAAGVTVFTLIWTGAIWLMATLGAPVLFVSVFGLFELILVYMMLQMWGGHATVQVSRDGIQVRSGFLLFTRTAHVRPVDVQDITTKIGMTSGNNAYYDIKVVRKGGRKVGAGSSISSKREAEWLVEKMKDAAGLRAS